VAARFRVPVSLLTGIVVFVALFPFSGDDSDPQKHRSVFGYGVPVGGLWLALVAGVVAALLVWMLLRDRSRS
jgi:hypothetical protein